MAFTDEDVAANGPKGASTFNYSRIEGTLVEGESGSPNNPAHGKESWRQRLKRENQERFTLSGVHKLRWSK